MSEPVTESKTAVDADRTADRDGENDSRTFPRWLTYLILPGVVIPVLILAFIFVTELAHDEKRCPYQAASLQTLSPSVSVREDQRRCLPWVEERRYTALHAGAPHVLGRRRFAPSAFAAGNYSWKASVAADGEVSVDARNAGHPDARFREGKPGEL